MDKPADLVALERDWHAWLATYFTRYLSYADGIPVPFADHHKDFWHWLWSIEPGVRPESFFGIWPRGGAKSTSAEMAVVALAARGVRQYGWYVSGTESQADDHLGNITGMLESSSLARAYPALTDRALGRYGNVKGWRRNRLRTASGFTIDSLGLDVAARGAKLDEQRPDFMIFDDIDEELDTLTTTEKKIKIITRKLLPAGAPDLAVVGIQNMVIPDGVFARVADGRADFLRRRVVSGPIVAAHDLEIEEVGNEWRVIAGSPTWEGQNLAVIQDQINDWGISAFLAEAQHEVEAPPGGMFDHVHFRHCTWDDYHSMIRSQAILMVVVALDPAVTKKDRSDAHGIQVDALHRNGDILRLFSWEQRATPRESVRIAILKAVELKASAVIVETDQGGDTWEDVYASVWRALVESGEIPAGTPRIPMRQAKAGSGQEPKAHRVQQMLVDYEQYRIVHVQGTHQTLEKALKRFPLTPPDDLADGAYWAWRTLREIQGPRENHARRYTTKGPRSVSHDLSW